ncbi:MAG: PqqD family protein [Litorilinea sp.]
MIYQINTPRIAHETIEGETIIIDFDSGTYYSAQNVAHDIWRLLDAGHDTQQIATAIATRYTGAQQEIAAHVIAFVEKLAADALIVVVPDAHPAETSVKSATALNGGAENGEAVNDAGALPSFAPPGLEQYTDMQDLLLLDPIHEVDEQGWPMLKQ